MGNSFEKVFIGNAGSAGGASLDIDNVFSTYLYDGAQTTLVVNNGIDLATEDGITWIKCRNASEDHFLFSGLQNSDGQTLFVKPNQNNAANATNGISQTSTGFSLGGGSGSTNQINNQYVSWTFRKAPKFFDIVKYTGNATANRTISHNLGSVPGMILIKGLDNTFSWHVFHRSLPTETGDFPYTLSLDTSAAQAGSQTYYGSGITSTGFKINRYNAVNQANKEYVAYIFAHNDGDGEFGPDADQDIIKCGSYNAVSAGTEIDIGFEPQWIIVKKITAENWMMYDAMRGVVTGGGNSLDRRLKANTDSTEAAVNAPIIAFSAKGFVLESTNDELNGSGATYIYMAIRRGPLAVPTDATKVFNASLGSSSAPGLAATFPIDMSIFGGRTGTDKFYAMDRIRGGSYSFTNTTAAEVSSVSFKMFQNNSDYYAYSDALGTNYIGWLWKRAPGYFDVVAYTGTGGASQSISHNLGVVPEMIWVKDRGNSSNWSIYHSALGVTRVINFDTGAGATGNGYWGTAAHTTSVFKVGSDTDTGANARNYVAYLFATAPGVSKLGSYDGNNATGRVIDCGFSNGAKFVLIKRTDGGGDWAVWDSVRGIVAGNDSRLRLHSGAAEVTGYDILDPHSSGFIVNQDANLSANESNQSYIFYAIA